MATDALTLVTPKATLSFPHFDQPQQPQPGSGGKAKYSGVFVFAAGTDLAPLKAAVMAAAEAKWPGKAAAMFKSNALRSPFRTDGESKGYAEGSTFISARSEQKPGLVYLHAGADNKPARVADADVREVFYPGAQVRAQLRAFAYDSNGNKGVSFALNNVQKLGDGPRLDNRQDAVDAFEADLSATPADLADLL